MITLFLEKMEAGMVLEGWEVKGIRDLKVQLKRGICKNHYKGIRHIDWLKYYTSIIYK
jgi:tmRNA-binding protein